MQSMFSYKEGQTACNREPSPFGPLNRPNDAFPKPFHKLQLVKPLPFVIPEA